MNFLTKHSKAFYYAYGILIGALIILGVFYASQYYNIRVLYAFDANGQLSILSTTTDKLNRTNSYLFDYFTNGNSNGLVAATGFSTDFSVYAKTVYDFQVLLSDVNNLIIYMGCGMLVCFALLLVLSNHNRRIYYLSNVIGGVLLPLIVIVLAVVLLVRNMVVIADFELNKTLFNIVNLLQGDSQISFYQQNYSALEAAFNCNTLSLTLFSVLFIVVIAYSAFMAVYAIIKFKATAEERAEIEKKAVANND